MLLLGGQPIREPVFSYGPFVMNTKSEILDTLDEWENHPESFGRAMPHGH